MNPVGCLVAGAGEAILLHEGLQQVQGMAVASLPVSVEAAGDLGKDMAGQGSNVDPGQNQESAVVGDKVQALRALSGRPANPPISRSALPGGRAEEQTSQGLGATTANQ